MVTIIEIMIALEISYIFIQLQCNFNLRLEIFFLIRNALLI